MRRLESVQILRGVAALLVVATHTNLVIYQKFPEINPLTKWPHFGEVGVDVFFVISGFVMAFTMDRYKGRHLAFLKQRFWRVAPLCYLAVLAWSAVVAWRGDTVDVRGIISTLTFVPIFMDYVLPAIPVVWTLSFEAVLYLIVCIALRLERGPRTVLATLLLLAAVGTAWHGPSPLLRWFTNPILLEFALGVAAFLIWRSGSVRPAVIWAGAIVGVAIFLLQIVFGPIMPGDLKYILDGSLSLLRAVAWGVPAFLIFNAALLWIPEQESGPALTSARAVGDATYSIYLTHWCTIQLIALAPLTSPTAAWLTLFCAATAVGLIVHLKIERPISRSPGIGSWFARKPTRQSLL